MNHESQSKIKIIRYLFISIGILSLWFSFIISERIYKITKISLLFTKDHDVSLIDVKLFFIYLGILSLIISYKLHKYNNQIISYNKWSKRIELDVIRVCAMVSIILFHWQPYGNYFPSKDFLKNLHLNEGILKLINDIMIYISQFGYLAVGVFIILSGLSLSMNYYANLSVNRKVYWKKFYLKRFIRILPLYWIVLSLSFILAILSGKNVSFKGFMASSLLLQNYYTPWSVELAAANQPLWFIPLLIALYLLFPFLLWLKRVLGDPCFLGMLIGFSIIYFNTFAWILPFGRIGEFGFGIVLGYYMLDESLSRIKLLIGPLQLLCTVILFWSLVFISSRGLRDALIQPILPIILFIFFLNLSYIFMSLHISGKIFSCLASASYAAYLIHPLGLRLFQPSFVHRTNILIGILFAIIILSFSWYIYLIDNKIKHKLVI